MEDNGLKPLEDCCEKQFIEWTEKFEKMIVDGECPKCGWCPDSDNYVISYGPKKYSYHLSLLSSFPQHVWSVIYKCSKCNTIFKDDVESI